MKAKTFATLTTKGQLTVPKEIREYLNLSSGDKIEFVISEKGKAIMKPVSQKVDNLYGRLFDESRVAVTTEEMKESIAKLLESKFK